MRISTSNGRSKKEIHYFIDCLVKGVVSDNLYFWELENQGGRPASKVPMNGTDHSCKL